MACWGAGRSLTRRKEKMQKRPSEQARGQETV
jgi:hypothetical protein